jgi:hypothetical protein
MKALLVDRQIHLPSVQLQVAVGCTRTLSCTEVGSLVFCVIVHVT